MMDKTQRLINGLGLTFKIITGLMFGAGIMGLLMYAVMTAITGGEFPPADGSEAQLSPLLAFLLKHYALLALAQAVVAAGLFYTSFQFVKLRRWARNVLEKFVWFLGGLVICFAVFIIISPPFNLPSLAKFMMAASMGFWLIPVAIMIWLLRKREVKEAFEIF
jgi:magnesium-transporting ATPase (P-type)